MANKDQEIFKTIDIERSMDGPCRTSLLLFSSKWLQSKYIKHALVNSKFGFDVESLDLKFELIFGNSNESTNFSLKLQNSCLGVSAYLTMSGT